MKMLPLGTIVKFSPEYTPRENDREGVVTELIADRFHKVEWTALGSIKSYYGFYEGWQLAPVVPAVVCEPRRCALSTLFHVEDYLLDCGIEDVSYNEDAVFLVRALIDAELHRAAKHHVTMAEISKAVTK